MAEDRRLFMDCSKEIDHIEVIKSDGRLKESMLLYDKLIEKVLQDKHEITKDDSSDKSKSDLLSLLYNNRGHNKYLLVEFEEATTDFDSALNYDPQNLKAYYNRGLIKYRMGYFEDARKDMIAVQQLDPNFKDANLCLEQCLTELKSI